MEIDMLYEKKIIQKAHAKINLYLDCDCRAEAKRADGYHNITSVMHSVSLADTVTLTLRKGGEDALTCSDPSIPTGDGNIALKALRAFRECTGLKFSASIDIEKRIPAAGGLAGGSSDAAAVLRALRLASECEIRDEEMTELAASVGSDVPFCLFGGTKLVRGKGEILSDLENRFDSYILLATRGEGVSTPWAYSLLDERYGTEKCLTTSNGSILESLTIALAEGDIDGVARHMYNVFEDEISRHRPDVLLLKQSMEVSWAKRAMMSGSGPTVMGIFDSRDKAENTAVTLQALGARTYMCRTI